MGVSYPLEVSFLNIGAIHLYFSTHNQFGLKFKLTQFSMNFIDTVTKNKMAVVDLMPTPNTGNRDI